MRADGVFGRHGGIDFDVGVDEAGVDVGVGVEGVDLVAIKDEIGAYRVDNFGDASILDVDGREDFGVEGFGWGEVDGAAEEDVA